MRSPPYEARASPTPRPRATQDVTFRVDQVLRRHRSSYGPDPNFHQRPRKLSLARVVRIAPVRHKETSKTRNRVIDDSIIFRNRVGPFQLLELRSVSRIS